VLEILIDVSARYPRIPPPADIDRDSVEWIEHILNQYDEHDRHVIDLAPSVPSPNQVARLSEQYQRMARERVDSVERARKLKAEQPDNFRGWFY
jgi:hypothetical protein